MTRRKAELILSADEQAQLSTFARSRSLPAALSQRARIVLACAAGEANSAVARRFELNDSTVGKWRSRFVKHRIAGLYDELRPGRPRTTEYEQVAGLIRKTLRQKPKDGSTHWSVRRAVPQRRAVSPNPAFTAICNCSASSPIAARASNSPRMPSSSRSCAMWWGGT
jgi:putative transposase